MTRRARLTDLIIAALVSLYPPRWRYEYGDELQDVLRQRPLRLGSAIDVAWHGVCQRWHEGGPVLAIGLFLLPWVSYSVAMNVMTTAGTRGAYCADNMLRDSSIRADGPFVSVHHIPSVIVAPGGPEFYAWVLLACGFITRLRESGASHYRPGVAAAQLAAVTGLPVMLLGVLLLTGVVDLRVISSSAANSTTAVAAAAGHGWTYTYCSERSFAPAALSIFTAPLLRLPLAFVYGWWGGLIPDIWRRMTQAVR